MPSDRRSSQNPEPSIRQVTEAEAERVTELFALAFHEDPTWGWAFPNPDTRLAHHRILWGLFMHSALPHGSVWTTKQRHCQLRAVTLAEALQIEPITLLSDRSVRLHRDMAGRMRARCSPTLTLISPLVRNQACALCRAVGLDEETTLGP
jgi:hypothetical protein